MNDRPVYPAPEIDPARNTPSQWYHTRAQALYNQRKRRTARARIS